MNQTQTPIAASVPTVGKSYRLRTRKSSFTMIRMSLIQSHWKALSRIILLVGVCALMMGGACSKKEQQRSDLETELISTEPSSIPSAQTDALPTAETTSTRNTDTAEIDPTTSLNQAEAPQETPTPLVSSPGLSSNLNQNNNKNKKYSDQKQTHTNASDSILIETEQTGNTSNLFEKTQPQATSGPSTDLKPFQSEFPPEAPPKSKLSPSNPIPKKKSLPPPVVTPEKTETLIEAMMGAIFTHQRASFVLGLLAAIGLVMLLTRKRSENS